MLILVHCAHFWLEIFNFSLQVIFLFIFYLVFSFIIFCFLVISRFSYIILNKCELSFELLIIFCQEKWFLTCYAFWNCRKNKTINKRIIILKSLSNYSTCFFLEGGSRNNFFLLINIKISKFLFSWTGLSANSKLLYLYNRKKVILF